MCLPRNRYSPFSQVIISVWFTYIQAKHYATMFILALLSIILKPLSRLRKSVQSGTDDIMSSMSHGKADLKDLITVDELARVYTRYNDMKAAAAAQNVII